MKLFVRIASALLLAFALANNSASAHTAPRVLTAAPDNSPLADAFRLIKTRMEPKFPGAIKVSVDTAYLGTHTVDLRMEKPVNVPSDLAGVKMRMPPGPAFQTLAKVLGATVVSMPITEVYHGLKTGSPAGERRPLREVPAVIGRASLSLTPPVVLLGGIWSGIFTPTEAAAVAALWALILGIWPFVLALTAILLLLTVFPSTTLFVPRLFGYQ